MVRIPRQARGAGRFRSRVTIQSPSETRDAQGNRAVTWSDHLTNVPAEIEDRRGSEQVMAQRLQGIDVTEVTVGLTPDTETVGHGHRLVDASGKIWDIKSVERDPLSRVVTYLCQYGVARG